MIGAGEISRRYARAIFGLAEGGAAHAKLAEQVRTLSSEITGSAELSRVLLTPIHPRVERKALVRELTQRLGLTVEITAVSEILVDENRLQLLPAIAGALQELVDQEAGRVSARVVSARPLDADSQEKIRAALARRVNADVAVEWSVDPALIGGVVARIGDLLLDGSIRTQLEQLEETLRKGPAT
ncbi:MAG TPA: ATP synthase F1 subunit delta [Myxococcota bacterium]|nr:ATP synthase F1 subunit delta [Myxococcota bacterium]